MIKKKTKMFSLKDAVLSLQNNAKTVTLYVVYLSFLLDNILLTMIVPIMPDFLIQSAENGEQLNLRGRDQEFSASFSTSFLKTLAQSNRSDLENYKSSVGVTFDPSTENGKIGFLLSSKALVQLFLNPLIGTVTAKIGYNLPLFLGTCLLLASGMVFAFGTGYFTLLLARSLQGVASSCIGITGMCLIAEKYPEEPERSKMMGFVLGSVAVGVLIGYPFGGFMYSTLGKPFPFIILVILAGLDGALQLCLSDLRPLEQKPIRTSEWLHLLSDKRILLAGAAIGISTSTIAILEPCLPIWLLKEIKPKKWQLGTAFIPDSLGYVIGTNSLGILAYQLGRSKVALPAMILVGFSAFSVPLATSMLQLIIPHFLLGFGIGAVDAALVPLLASLVDSGYSTHYGAVYAVQQISVSLAYALGPVFGSEIARAVGFPWMMRVVGLINVFYSPFLLVLERLNDEDCSERKQEVVNYQKRCSRYQEFSESDDSG